MPRDLLTERYAERKRAATARAAALRAQVPALVSRLVAEGARRVVLFGSLASGAEPHAGTDVDLCVEGLADRVAALLALELELMAGARVDVVCWESASAQLRTMIETYGQDVTSRVERVENGSPHGLKETEGETVRALASAFQIERYYTGVESLLSRVLRTIDEDVPGGRGSHQARLSAAAVPIDGLRAAVLSARALQPLRELLAFRHYARHGYDVEPKVKRVDEIVTVLLDARPIIVECVRQFAASLSPAA